MLQNGMDFSEHCIRAWGLFFNVPNNLCSLFILYQVNDTLLVNELKSREPDLMATNGVIHVIDKLLYPAGEY